MQPVAVWVLQMQPDPHSLLPVLRRVLLGSRQYQSLHTVHRLLHQLHPLRLLLRPDGCRLPQVREQHLPERQNKYSLCLSRSPVPGPAPVRPSSLLELCHELDHRLTLLPFLLRTVLLGSGRDALLKMSLQLPHLCRQDQVPLLRWRQRLFL